MRLRIVLVSLALFLGVAGGARQQAVQRLRGADEAVLGALGLRQHFVQQAFAHAEGREHDGLRPRDPNNVFEHQSRIGQQRPPRVGDDLDIGQHVGRRQPPQPLREVERVGGGKRIAVHHPQRIAALDDVDARQDDSAMILTNTRIVHVVVWSTGIPMRRFITEMHDYEWGLSLSDVDPRVRWAITEEGDQLWHGRGKWLQKNWIEVAVAKTPSTAPVHLYRRPD